MTKHVRHIWAKANQHIKVHRYKPQSSGDKGADTDNNTLYIIIAIIVFIWIIM